MDNREVKFILSAYRPAGQDASDPRFAEALDQARHDPILQLWFEESVAFDAAMAQKLCGMAVPDDLRENILIGVKVGCGSGWTKRFGKWAIAAAFILVAAVGSLIWHDTRPAHLTGWQSAALEVISSLVRNESSFDAQSRSSGDLVGWLRANHAPAAGKLPDSLKNLESIGCKKFSWNGVSVSVICFTRSDGGLIHLVAMKAVGKQGKGGAHLVQRGGWATATWRDGDMIYMLALEGSPDQLRSYLL